jgi:hypothetical protein
VLFDMDQSKSSDGSASEPAKTSASHPAVSFVPRQYYL